MRRATGISLSLHGLILAGLVAVASTPPQTPAPPAAPKPMAVALAPQPARKQPEPQPAPKPPQPEPQPQPKPKPKPQARPIPAPAKPVARPLAAAPTPLPAAPPVETASASAAPATAPAAAPAPPAPRSADPDASWLGAVRARLEAAKRYPPAAARRGDQGVASIHLEIAPDGRILSVTLAGTSGSGLLDREALDLPRRIAALPPMPAAMGHAPVTLVVPVSFTLR